MEKIKDPLEETAFEGWTHSVLLTPKLVRDSETPIYNQLAFAIAATISNRQIKKDYLMPSVADYASLNNISINTVSRTYRFEKSRID